MVTGLIAIRGLAPSPALSFLLIDLHPWSQREEKLDPEVDPKEGHTPLTLKDGAGRSVWRRQGQLQRVPADRLPQKADCDAQIGRRGESIQQVFSPSKKGLTSKNSMASKKWI